MRDKEQDSTQALVAHVSGDGAGVDQLVAKIYDRLRGLARSYMKGERGYQTIEPTALVHEAYLRLIDITRVDWQGKSHFYAMAARQMRRILVERARSSAAKKRGGGAVRVTLHDHIGAGQPSLDLIALDEALEKLSQVSPRQSRVVELRLFAGMQMNEIAHVVGVSDRTIKSDWKVARAWLAAELGPTGSDSS
jgi:RNA polymerase sigma factor (TIGR02999 family)